MRRSAKPIWFPRCLGLLGLLGGAALAQGGTWSPGTRVEASPMQMAQFWEICTIRSGPDRWDTYQVECGKYVLPVPRKWIRAAPSAATTDAAAPQSPSSASSVAAPANTPAPSAARPADAPATAVALGTYECWAFGRARMDLNFVVTGPGAYRASDDTVGTFSFDAATQAIRFTGFLRDVLPEDFSTIYYEPNGRPTVSFRGRSGAEASFCERI